MQYKIFLIMYTIYTTAHTMNILFTYNYTMTDGTKGRKKIRNKISKKQSLRQKNDQHFPTYPCPEA